MDLDRAFEYALDGKALLFAGAGFSRGALNLRKQPFKTGPQLAAHIAKTAKLPEGTPLDDATEEFLERFGEEQFIRELEQEFTTTKVSKAHLQFAKLPWKRIYTTNYDNVLEYSFTQTQQRLRPITPSEKISEISKDSTWCVHLNGFIGKLTLENISSEVKLTDTSYLTAVLAESPWAAVFREDLSLANAVFFVGYSLADLDIKRLLFERQELKDKCFFVLGEQPTPSALSRAKRFGTVLQINADKFAEMLGAKARAYTPALDVGPVPHCLERFDVGSKPAPFTDRLVFDLMLWGQIRDVYVWKGINGGRRYVEPRQSATTVMSRIQAGVGVVVVHSDLGNGKSVLLEEIKCKAKAAGYSVQTLVKRGDSLREEIEWALHSEDRTLFFVDNYPDWLDALKLFARLPSKRASIVLTARTSTHDVLVERLSEILASTTLEEIIPGKLSRTEIEGVVDYFDEYGLWGETAGWSRTQKIDFLIRVCHSEWHAILIKLLESPQIQSKFEKVFSDLQKQRNYYQTLIAILVFAVLGRSLSFDELVDYCGQPVLETAFKRDAAIREVVDFSLSEVRLRSSVTGQFILKSVADPNSTVEVLVGLARTADKIANVSSQAFDLLKSISRFSNLQSFLPEKGKRGAILRYYESCKGLPHCKTNPLFWLQYAIACTTLEEFIRAEKYFDAAYSFADKRQTYDSYQIDNHYARFLIMRAIHSHELATAMNAFREARKIIFSQIQNERLHYPYRVAKTFGIFYDTFVSEMDSQQKEEIKRAAKHIVSRIETLPEMRQENRIVEECWRAMQQILGSK